MWLLASLERHPTCFRLYFLVSGGLMIIFNAVFGSTYIISVLNTPEGCQVTTTPGCSNAIAIPALQLLCHQQYGYYVVYIVLEVLAALGLFGVSISYMIAFLLKGAPCNPLSNQGCLAVLAMDGFVYLAGLLQLVQLCETIQRHHHSDDGWASDEEFELAPGFTFSQNEQDECEKDRLGDARKKAKAKQKKEKADTEAAKRRFRHEHERAKAKRRARAGGARSEDRGAERNEGIPDTIQNGEMENTPVSTEMQKGYHAHNLGTRNITPNMGDMILDMGGMSLDTGGMILDRPPGLNSNGSLKGRQVSQPNSD
ncbi:hypothetical protein J7T55_010929 [Diaporthe amygdali]|uniref:uncharacterized protein n=1 Tax=Phomopsis amygdali TaxID=1214568 RepID=UPI0022FF4241|nr:uncharacterized protein J7T55_010929 [Diaporthe amygdali]KAJ0104463.1 hypothetical protein J7T55_010929 [Diaporthe amygdali]